MPSRRSCLRALVWALATCVGTLTVWRALTSRAPEPLPFEMRARSISAVHPEAAVAQFRRVVTLPSAVRSAWVAVAAHEGYEIVVNGVTAGRSVLWRPTRPFQTGWSERGQRIVSPEPMLRLSFPREYQWEGHESERLPAFFDIAPFLSPGKNVLSVEVETRAPPARLALEGEILLWSGERLRLESDSSFRVAPGPPAGGRLWTQCDFSDLDWPAAAIDASPPRWLRTLDPDVYREPFAGRWLRAPEVLDGAAWFQTTWSLERRPREAWIRLLANRPFELFVNDHAVRVSSSGAQELDAGEWIVGPRPSVDAPANAESLDPDEVGTLFVGPRFEPPTGEDENRLPGGDFDSEAMLRGQDDDRRPAEGEAESRDEPPQALAPPGQLAAPERVAPKELAGGREQAVFYAYAVQGILEAGDNRVAIRLSAPEGPSRPVWSPKLAVDGQASFPDGVSPSRLGSASEWTVRAQAAAGALSEPAAALPGGAASAPGAGLPRMQYRGFAAASWRNLLPSVALSLVLAALGLALLAHLPAAFRRAHGWVLARRGEPIGSGAPASAEESTWVIVLPVALLCSVLLVELSWGERDEILALLTPTAWRLLAAAAMLLGTGAAAALSRGSWRRSPEELWSALPKHRAWPLLVALVLALGGVLRAHEMQSQPLDDDEFASAQAALAIAHTGLPKYSNDVYYTRGPLYHYVAGASVRLFGESVSALRLPSLLFAIATAWLIYLAGARLLRSRWTGLAAAALYAIHPYAIFVGHLVRFYQQQQFFTLATLYCFCRGFVSEQRLSARYLTLASFSAACLSQELSIVIVPGLLVAWVIFAEKKGRGAPSLALSAGCVAALFVIDILIFQTQCLTKLEGISPNVEATLALHFMSPMNLLALFVSYSRLHLVLTLFLLASLPLLVRAGNMDLLALLVVFFSGVLSTNMLVTGDSLRYQYWLLPLWLLLGVHGLRALVRAVADRDDSVSPFAVGRRWIAPAVGALALSAVVLSFSPWRIAGSYSATLLGDSSAAFGYVRSHLREGDKVAATEPHAHAGLVELGRIDYDLAVPLLHDFVYRKDGRLVDRNGSAQVVSTLEQLQEVLSQNDRLWVLVNREKFRSRGQDIRWEYPAARLELFLRRNFEIKFQSYLWTVFLWDVRSGKFHSLPASARLSWRGASPLAGGE